MITVTLDIEWAIQAAPPIVRECVIEWAILAAAVPTDAIQTSRTIEWAILASDPIPTGAITTTQNIVWRIWGSTSFELRVSNAPTGLTGIMTIRITTATGDVIYPQTTGGIVEQPPGLGRYVATIPEFGAGAYFAIWNDGVTDYKQGFELSLGSASYPALAGGRIYSGLVGSQA